MVKQWKKCKVCQISNKCCQGAWKLRDAKWGIKRLLFLCNFYGIDLEVIANWNCKLNNLDNIFYLPFLLKWIQRYVGLELQVFSCLKAFQDYFPKFFLMQKALSKKKCIHIVYYFDTIFLVIVTMNRYCTYIEWYSHFGKCNDCWPWLMKILFHKSFLLEEWLGWLQLRQKLCYIVTNTLKDDSYL